MNLVEELTSPLLKAVFSDPEDAEYKKITVRPVQGKTLFYQAERFKGTQVFHLNLNDTEMPLFLQENGAKYRQISLFFEGKTVSFSRNSSGSYKRKESENELKNEVLSHNRTKNYLLNEGDEIPAMVDLGVFTKDYKIVKSKYDKFKQINRFIELVADSFQGTKEKSLTILDFGCGKSYLTFILYYYFTVRLGLEVNVIVTI